MEVSIKFNICTYCVFTLWGSHESLTLYRTLKIPSRFYQEPLKIHGPICQNGVFYTNDASSSKKSWFQFSVKSVKPFGYAKRLHILQLPILTV